MAEKDDNKINLDKDDSGSSEDASEAMQGASGEDLERRSEKQENSSKEGGAVEGVEGGAVEGVEGGAVEGAEGGAVERDPPWIFIAPSESSDSGYTPPGFDRNSDTDGRISDTSLRASDPDPEPDLPPNLRAFRELYPKKDGPIFGLLRQKRGYRPYYFLNPSNDPFYSRQRPQGSKSQYEGPFLLSIKGPAGSGVSAPSTSGVSAPSTSGVSAPSTSGERSSDCESDKSSKSTQLKVSIHLKDICFHDSESPCRSPQSEASTLSSCGYLADDSSLTSSDCREYSDFFSLVVDQTNKLRKGSQSTIWHQAVRNNNESKRESQNCETGRYIPVEGPYHLQVSNPPAAEGAGPSTAEIAGPSTAEGGERSNVDKSVFKNVLYLQGSKQTNTSGGCKPPESKKIPKLGIRLEDVRVLDAEDFSKSNSPSETSSKSTSRSESPKTVPKLESPSIYTADDNALTSSNEREYPGSKDLKTTESPQASQSNSGHEAVGTETSFVNVPEIHVETGKFFPVEGPFLIAAPDTSSNASEPSTSARPDFKKIRLILREEMARKRKQRIQEIYEKAQAEKESRDSSFELQSKAMSSISPEGSQKMQLEIEKAKKEKQETNQISSNKPREDEQYLEIGWFVDGSYVPSCSKPAGQEGELECRGKQKRHLKTLDSNIPKSKLKKTYNVEISSPDESRSQTSEMIDTQPTEHIPGISERQSSYPEAIEMPAEEERMDTESLFPSTPLALSGTPDVATEDTSSSIESKKDSSTSSDQ